MYFRINKYQNTEIKNYRKYSNFVQDSVHKTRSGRMVRPVQRLGMWILRHSHGRCPFFFVSSFCFNCFAPHCDFAPSCLSLPLLVCYSPPFFRIVPLLSSPRFCKNQVSRDLESVPVSRNKRALFNHKLNHCRVDLFPKIGPSSRIECLFNLCSLANSA